MPLPPDLDLIDLAILQFLAIQGEAVSREIEAVAFLSRSRVLKRLRDLEQQGLVVIQNGIGLPYRFSLGENVTLEEIEERLTISRESVVQELNAIKNRIANLTRRIERGILGQ